MWEMYLDTFTPTSHILHKDQFWVDWGYKCTGGNTIKHLEENLENIFMTYKWAKILEDNTKSTNHKKN